MNWTAGIIAFVLFFIPMTILFVIWYKRDQAINREYEQKLKAIEERYYGNTRQT